MVEFGFGTTPDFPGTAKNEDYEKWEIVWGVGAGTAEGGLDLSGPGLTVEIPL